MTQKRTAIKLARQEHVLNAAELPVGRLATEAVRFLTGKHKPQYQPNLDLGDFVTIINANQVKLTGRKFFQKVYFDMSRYPGGIRQRSVQELARTNPADIYRRAIFAMLPKNRHRSVRVRRLTVKTGQ